MELWDSAQIDGAGHLRYLWRIMVPLSVAPIMTLGLFGFIGSWNALAWPILVTSTPDWRPISYGMLAFLDEAGAQFHLQMAGAVITMVPILILYFFTQKQFIEGIATSGLKEAKFKAKVIPAKQVVRVQSYVGEPFLQINSIRGEEHQHESKIHICADCPAVES